jgi:endoglucanase
MKKSSVEFFKRLLALAGPSGFEVAPARAWREEAEKFADRVWADVAGNSFAALEPDTRPRVMLAGHIDEIGLMVNHIDDDGFLYFSAIGGWDPEIIVGQRVQILTQDGPLPGLIGKKAIHLQEKEEREKAAKVKDLWIDIGAADGEEARARVRVGDAAVLDAPVLELPNSRISSRAIDNRMGAFVALEALRRLAAKRPRVGVVAVVTAQEEISLSSGGGARSGAFGLDPEVPVLFERMAQVAERENIPFSIEAAPSRTSTDADNVAMARSGIATALVSVPNRYMHSPNEMVSLEDLERAAELIAATVRTLSSKDDFIPA